MIPKTTTQAEFGRLIGCTQQNVSLMKSSGKLVVAGQKIDTTASLNKLIEAARERRESTLDFWRAERLRRQCRKYDDALAERIRVDISRDLAKRLRPLKAAIAKAGRESEPARLELCAMIAEVVA